MKKDKYNDIIAAKRSADLFGKDSISLLCIRINKGHVAIAYPSGIEKLVIISAGTRPKNTRLNS